MRRNGTRIWLTAASVAAIAGAVQAPAMAAPSTTAAISISAQSALKPITGKVLVVFRAGNFANANIKGSVTGATSGQVLQLFGQKFPFNKAPMKLGSPVTLTGASMNYSFKVTPTLATHYRVELFTDSSEQTPVTQSGVQNVYVAARGVFSGIRSCNRPGQRPVCHQRIHITVTVPPSALGTERHKAWHPYFGLTLRSSGTPPRPKTLKLNGGHAHVVGTRKLNSQQYRVTITYSFRIGNNAAFFVVTACQRDTEATDGLNLPGHHGCGDKVISSRVRYLG